MARKKKHPKLSKPVDGTSGYGATPQRLAKAGTDIHVDRIGKVQYMRDTAIDRALNRGRISPKQYDAGVKYYHHCFHADLIPSLQGNWSGVYANAEAFFSGLAPNDKALFHRDQYWAGKRELEKIQCREAVELFIFNDTPPLEIGFRETGYKDKSMAEAAGIQTLKIGLNALVTCYGL